MNRLEAFNTQPLQDAADRLQVFRVAMVIARDYITADWEINFNVGSITLQNPPHRSEVVTVFKDYGQKVAQRAGINHPVADPVGVLMTIECQWTFVRRSLRARLESLYGSLYINPEREFVLYQLPPNMAWHFDLLFLPPGECEEIELDVTGDIEEFFNRRSRSTRVGDLLPELKRLV